MKLTITIEMDNAAFGNDGIERGMEVSRILSESVNRLTDDIQTGDCCPLLDINGNSVGLWDVTDGEE